MRDGSIKNLMRLLINSKNSKDAGLSMQAEISLLELQTLVDASIEIVEYKRKLEEVLREILEDAEAELEKNELRIGFVNVTWISLNKAKKILIGE
jgi:hypothetical protein